MVRLFSRKFFWVYGKTDQGKPVVYGPCSSEDQAERIVEKLEDAQVLKLSTKNQQVATRQIKAKLAERTGVMDTVVRRFRHKSNDQIAMIPLEEEAPSNELQVE